MAMKHIEIMSSSVSVLQGLPQSLIPPEIGFLCLLYSAKT